MFVLTIGTHSELKPLMKCTGQQESAWHGQNTCCGKPLFVEILLSNQVTNGLKPQGRPGPVITFMTDHISGLLKARGGQR